MSETNMRDSSAALVWLVGEDPGHLPLSRTTSETYELLPFADAEMVLDSLELTFPPDLIVVDEGAVRRSGLELQSYVRSLRSSVSDRPLLVLTDSHAFADATASIRAGASDVLSKPCSPFELVARIEAALEAHRLKRRAERAEEFLQAVVEGSGDAQVLLDGNGRVLFLNSRAADLLRAPRSQLVGRMLSDLMPELGTEILRTATRGETQTAGSVQVSGQTCIAAIRLLRDSAAPSFLLTLREPSQREMLEHALQESEARFRGFAECLPQLVWTARANGAWDFVTQSWNTYTGRSADDHIAEGWLQSVHREDRQAVLGTWFLAIETRSIFEQEFRILARDGTTRWFQARAVPMVGSDGEVIRWLGTCTDIDAQKRAEASLREADRRKTEFLGLLAHELRNPLAAVRTASELLGTDGTTVAENDKMVGVIQRQVGHMVRMIDDLLDVARINRGRITIRKEPLDLSELIRSTAEDRRKIFEGAGKTLELVLPQVSLHTQADSTRLAQAFGNLLHNAFKFTRPGDTVRVELTGSPETGHARLVIRDTGLGIAPELLERIFEPFAQAEASLARPLGGLGLGLTLVRMLISAHGGRIEAQSEGDGKGAEFIIELPLEQPAERRSVVPRPPSVARKRRLLIVEDNADAGESLAILLRLRGHQVSLATDGAEGLDRAREDRPEVIICDIGLPGSLDGYQVARAIRSEAELASTYLVALTGYGQAHDKLRAREAGFDLHLTKPVDPRALCELLLTLPGSMPSPDEQVDSSSDIVERARL